MLPEIVPTVDRSSGVGWRGGLDGVELLQPTRRESKAPVARTDRTKRMEGLFGLNFRQIDTVDGRLAGAQAVDIGGQAARDIVI